MGRQKKERLPKACENCKEFFYPYPCAHAKARFCSRKCRYECMRGSKGPNFGGGDKIRGPLNKFWKGGPSKERQASWRGEDQCWWRRRVFERDNYTCQVCGQRSKLNAHHRHPWAEFPEERMSVDCGVTLCAECHKAVHQPVVVRPFSFDLSLLSAPVTIGEDGKRRTITPQEAAVILGLPPDWLDLSVEEVVQLYRESGDAEEGEGES